MLMSTIAISGFLGFTSLKQVYKNVNAEENSEKVELKTTKKNNVTYVDNDYTIDLDVEELNNYSWESFLSVDIDNTTWDLLTFNYDGNNYNYDSATGNLSYGDYYITFIVDNSIKLSIDEWLGSDVLLYHVYLINNDTETFLQFNAPLSIDISSYSSSYNDFKEAI